MGEYINIKNRQVSSREIRAQAKVERTKLYLVCQNENIIGSPSFYRYLGGGKTITITTTKIMLSVSTSLRKKPHSDSSNAPRLPSIFPSSEAIWMY